jgi:ABC-2 type transport system permease protein
LHRILTIFRKDFGDALRDSRVLLALVVPLGIGLLYNVIIQDEEVVPKATVAYVTTGQTQLLDQVRVLAGDTVRLRLRPVADTNAVRQLVEDEDADIGLVIPAGFDAAVARGAAPEIVVVLPPSPTFSGDYIAALLDPALRQMAGQAPPASVRADVLPPGAGENIMERVGARRYLVLGAILMLIAMIGMFAVPMVLADESEKKTLDALVLIASDVEVVAAKALFGLSYIAIGVPLLLVITGLRPDDPALFALGVVALGVLLTGIGLLLGGLLSATQLNTWGGLLLVPIILPMFVIGMPAPGWLDTVLALIPTTHAARLAVNGLSGEALFARVWLSAVVLAVWCAAAYALVLWRLARREA